MTNAPNEPGRRDENERPESADDARGAEAAGGPVASGARPEDGPAGADTTAPGAGIEDRTVNEPVDAEDEHPAPAHHADELDENAQRSGFAATALKILVFVLVIFGLALWIMPNVAPHLPAGVARHLMPGQVELDRRLAALAERIEASTAEISVEVGAIRREIATLGERLESVESVAGTAQAEAEAAREAAAQSAEAAEQNAVAGDTVARAEAAAREASELADTATTAATEAGKVASAATRDAASLARRMTEFEARLAGLADQVEAVNESLAAGAGEGEAAVPELAAAFAALEAEVDAIARRLEEMPGFITEEEADRFATQDDLRSARLALAAQIDEALSALPPPDEIAVEGELQDLRAEAEAAVGHILERVNAVEAAAQQAAASAGSAEAAATTAVERVDQAIAGASLRSAAAALTSRLTNGLPYAGALGEAAALIGTPPPPELSGPAETGVATAGELHDRFGPAARDALEAAIEAETGGGVLGQARARFRSVISGRAASELPGDTVEAILSRIDARLREDALAAALAEAEALPAPAQAAMGGWLEALRARVAAAEAAEEYLAPAAGTQG